MTSTEFATGSHKGKGAGFLFFLGFALLAAGVGFAFAPQYSWQVTKIAHLASTFGLQSGALVVGGLVLFGLGMVARVAGGSSHVSAPDTSSEHEAVQSELHLLNEQISSKLAQLRTSLLQINEGVTALSAHAQEQSQGGGQSAGHGEHSQEAVFRLAASLDKLHAHFDERVHAVDLQLRSGFESLLNVSHDMRRLLDQRAPAAPAARASSPAPQHAHGHPHAQAHAAHAQDHGQAQGPEGTIDFFETMQKLDAISGESTPPAAAQPRRPQPQAPFPSQGGDESLDALLPEEYRDRY